MVIGSDRSGTQQRFILALNDLTSERLNWNEAMARYGNYLPTMQQGWAWMSQDDDVYWTVRRLEGSWPYDDLYYWSKDKKSSSVAWEMPVGHQSIGFDLKSNSYRVRAVSPVQGI